MASLPRLPSLPNERRGRWGCWKEAVTKVPCHEQPVLTEVRSGLWKLSSASLFFG